MCPSVFVCMCVCTCVRACVCLTVKIYSERNDVQKYEYL